MTDMDEIRRINRTYDILEDIRAERRRQENKWGEQNHPLGFGGPNTKRVADFARLQCDTRAKKGVLTWEDILREEYSEALAEDDLAKAREELIQVAAVCVAIVDWIDRGAPDA